MCWKRDLTPAWSPSILLLGRPNQNQAAVGPRHGTPDQDQVPLAVDANDAQVARRHPFGAVTARHALAALGPAAAAIAGVRADAARRPVVLLDAVAGGQA